MRKKNLFRGMSVFILIAAMAAVPLSAGATHSWGNYHWARTSSPFTLTVVDSMTTNWDDNLTKAMTDWDKSTVMNLASGLLAK